MLPPPSQTPAAGSQLSIELLSRRAFPVQLKNKKLLKAKPWAGVDPGGPAQAEAQ
jgi:hypothetical protein